MLAIAPAIAVLCALHLILTRGACLPLKLFRASLGYGAELFRRRREAQAYQQPFAFLHRLNPHVCVVDFRNGLYDGQTQSGTMLSPAGGATAKAMAGQGDVLR